jgi:eukaryotic-like serine/threonine-protein kinase
MRNAIVALSLVLAACSQTRKSAPTPQAAVPAALIPSPIEPPDGSIFTHHPRTLHFRWSTAPQAVFYSIEIDCFHCCVKDRWCSDAQGRGYVVQNLTQPAYEFEFWGDQAGRWRVWAVNAHSQPGPRSPWSGFSFRSQ